MHNPALLSLSLSSICCTPFHHLILLNLISFSLSSAIPVHLDKKCSMSSTILTQPFLSTETSPSAGLNLQACCTTSHAVLSESFSSSYISLAHNVLCIPSQLASTLQLTCAALQPCSISTIIHKYITMFNTVKIHYIAFHHIELMVNNIIVPTSKLEHQGCSIFVTLYWKVFPGFIHCFQKCLSEGNPWGALQQPMAHNHLWTRDWLIDWLTPSFVL